MKGNVVYWNQIGGYGFLYSEETKRRVFFHVSSLTGAAAPRINQSVTFELAPDKRGKADKAVNVQIMVSDAGLAALAKVGV